MISSIDAIDCFCFLQRRVEGEAHSSGVILLGHRVPATSLHWTADEGKTWRGPVRIDTVGGAYPSMVELPDGLVYCVYCEEGKGSSIRAVRLRVDTKGLAVVGEKD